MHTVWSTLIAFNIPIDLNYLATTPTHQWKSPNQKNPHSTPNTPLSYSPKIDYSMIWYFSSINEINLSSRFNFLIGLIQPSNGTYPDIPIKGTTPTYFINTWSKTVKMTLRLDAYPRRALAKHLAGTCISSGTLQSHLCFTQITLLSFTSSFLIHKSSLVGSLISKVSTKGLIIDFSRLGG